MKNVRDCRPGEKGTPMLNIVDNDPAGENSRSILDDLVREGARRMLVTALEIEIETYVQSHHNALDDDGHRLVVRNGTSPVRSIKTGAGPLQVEQPRINDRRVDRVTGKRQKFSSAILPPWARSSPNINDVLPLMYLHGMSTSDFLPALEQFCGTTAGLSASTITRLTTEWQADHKAFHDQSFAAKRFVYIWADGIHFRVRLAEERLCVLVLMGVTTEGTKELIAVHSGVRESTDSWADLLRDLRRRGLTAPKVLVGDGALGLWAAATTVWPDTTHQRCWFHKSGNVLSALPKTQHPSAKRMLTDIRDAATLADANTAIKCFQSEFGVKWPKAAAKIVDDRNELLAFFNFPAEHWVHLKTTNPIESTFATVRLRTRVTKGPGSGNAGIAMAFKLLQAAQTRWRKCNAPHLLPAVANGDKFINGKHTPTTNQTTKETAA
jgi:putative transposase